jgi:hypothetical protein
MTNTNTHNTDASRKPPNGPLGPKKLSGRAAVPEDETKNEKFRRLAKARVNKVVKAITNIGKLAASAYEYSPEEAAKVVGALQRAVADVEAKFAKTKPTMESFDLR